MTKSIVLVAIILGVYSGYAQDCDLKVNKNGIKVYTCEIKDSKFKAIKSSFQLKCTLSELAAALLDVENCGKWQYKTLKVQMLKKVSEHEVIYYTEVAAPILTSNRDFVINMTINQDSKTKDLNVLLVSIPTYIPEEEGIVRVPYSKARWIVKSNGAGLLLVDYSIEIDLGGSLPASLVNLVAPKAPYESFKDLQGIIGAYKGKGVAFIKD